MYNSALVANNTSLRVNVAWSGAEVQPHVKTAELFQRVQGGLECLIQFQDKPSVNIGHRSFLRRDEVDSKGKRMALHKRVRLGREGGLMGAGHCFSSALDNGNSCSPFCD